MQNQRRNRNGSHFKGSFSKARKPQRPRRAEDDDDTRREWRRDGNGEAPRRDSRAGSREDRKPRAPRGGASPRGEHRDSRDARGGKFQSGRGTGAPKGKRDAAGKAPRKDGFKPLRGGKRKNVQ